jgi:hypothetical protein
MTFDETKPYKIKVGAATGRRFVQDGIEYTPGGKQIAPPAPQPHLAPEFPPIDDDAPAASDYENILQSRHWRQIKMRCDELGIPFTNKKQGIAEILAANAASNAP